MGIDSTHRRFSWKGALARHSSALIFLFLFACFSLLSGRFLRIGNVVNILEQSSLLAVVAIGITFPIITGGIDLSVGSLVALCGALAAGLVTGHAVPVPLAIAMVLALGALLGGINGFIIVAGRFQPFVVTLATMAITRGATLVYTQGRPISGIPASFTFLGDRVAGVPVSLLILLIILILFQGLLRFTPFGAHLYALGGNEETARLAGISVHWIKIGAYSISGGMAALGGIILTARLWSAQPQAAVGLELQTIAAAVLGGVSLAGGSGGLAGTLLGALLMGTLANGLNLLGISSYLQQVIIGAIFIAAVMLDLWTKEMHGESSQGALS
ncbi:ribose ABC transporter permease [Alkalispirochaeta sphaeroplastigenens]|uniref:Ribose ABC transporter permease n=1 Tax=Alkalispirochaeta sphaeroplastigenens TaxID=1187066 RepID=A0A2S4JJF9_9SPIO|nr:ribose ABC transporter permease [Alkalispirochaeta sphaeroplastigenens]POQ99667.1 ribose ABC transporter permease [Alkalispirochaeta sphaeroplastigenens]